MSVDKRLKTIIVEQLSIEEEQVVPEATLEDLGADSLDMVELIMAIEEEFGIDIPDEDAEGLKSVGDTINYIQEKSGK